MSERVLVLVGCGKQKLSHAALAKDLYTSFLFKVGRAYAERFGDEWRIVSAFHGLHHPNENTLPYDLSIYDLLPVDRTIFGAECDFDLISLLTEAREELRPFTKIISLLPRAYWKEIDVLSEKVYKGAVIEHPLKNMGIGKRIAYLKRAVEDGNR